MSEITDRKFVNQRAGPFKVLKRVDHLTYKLGLRPHWKIHFIISVTQLEPNSKEI